MSKTFAYIPSAYKVGETYTAIPNDGNADFDFSRGSIATRINENGLIEEMAANVPRIDYRGGGCPVLLLEDGAENLVNTSARGVYGNPPPPSEITTESPEGLNNAFIPVPAFDYNRYEYVIPPNTFATGDEICYSWYRKRISTPTGVETIGDLDLKSHVNLTDVSGSKKQIQSNINGFDRFQGNLVVSDSALESKVKGYFGNVIGAGNSSVAYFGHQVERGSRATSYIPTNGAPVTREAEKCGGSVINIDANSCVWGLELQAREAGTTVRRVQMSGDTDNYIAFGYGDSSQSIFFTLYDGTTTSSIVFNNSDNTKLRTLTGLKNGNEQVFKIDGVMVGYLKTAPTLNNMTTMYYSSNGTGFFMDGKTRNNTIDDDVSSFDSTATSYTELDAQINNFTTR